MRIRALVVATMIGVLGLFPLSIPAQATHNCGFDPCPHPDDVVEYLCYTFPVLHKYVDLCSL